MSLCYEILIVVWVCFFSAVTSAFQLFTRKLCLQFSGLRMRNFTWNRFPINNLLIDSLLKLHPSWKVHTWIEICASLNHRKMTKADGSRLTPRKHTETVLLSVIYSKLNTQLKRTFVNQLHLQCWLANCKLAYIRFHSPTTKNEEYVRKRWKFQSSDFRSLSL